MALCAHFQACCLSIDDAEREMGNSCRLDHAGAFQLNSSIQVVEQADTCAQQERHQVDMDFVEQSGLEALLHNRGGGNDDTLLSGDCPVFVRTSPYYLKNKEAVLYQMASSG
jgi:hypothetical protein